MTVLTFVISKVSAYCPDLLLLPSFNHHWGKIIKSGFCFVLKTQHRFSFRNVWQNVHSLVLSSELQACFLSISLQYQTKNWPLSYVNNFSHSKLIDYMEKIVEGTCLHLSCISSIWYCLLNVLCPGTDKTLLFRRVQFSYMGKFHTCYNVSGKIVSSPFSLGYILSLA